MHVIMMGMSWTSIGAVGGLVSMLVAILLISGEALREYPATLDIVPKEEDYH